MADEFRMALEDLLSKTGTEESGFLRESVMLLAQELMEFEVSQHQVPGLDLGASEYGAFWLGFVHVSDHRMCRTWWHAVSPASSW